MHFTKYDNKVNCLQVKRCCEDRDELLLAGHLSPDVVSLTTLCLSLLHLPIIAFKRHSRDIECFEETTNCVTLPILTAPTNYCFQETFKRH